MRPTSVSFQQGSRDGDVSVYIASVANAEDVMAEGHEPFLASVAVSAVRACGLGVVLDPDGGLDGHALITGRKTKGIVSALAKAAIWVQPYAPRPVGLLS